jgi:hypothetical protein
MAALTLTPDMAYASGRDAGNVRMRKAGRTTWNRADYNHAANVTNRLLLACEGRWVHTLSPVAQTLAARHLGRLKAL